MNETYQSKYKRLLTKILHIEAFCFILRISKDSDEIHISVDRTVLLLNGRDSAAFFFLMSSLCVDLYTQYTIIKKHVATTMPAND